MVEEIFSLFMEYNVQSEGNLNYNFYILLVENHRLSSRETLHIIISDY